MEKSKDFRREGADVHSDLGVGLSQAILGGTIRIPGIYDDILLNVSTADSWLVTSLVIEITKGELGVVCD